MVPSCLTPEQNGSLLFNIGTKRFRFMASETNIFFLFNVLSKQMVLISVLFWMERFFCIQKEQLFPFSSTALLERGTPYTVV